MNLSLEKCNICPRLCRVNRYRTTGYCNARAEIKLNLYQLHYGEEPNLSGSKGSGTIFFSHCNLKCVYCQNFTISHFGWGKEVEPEELVDIMFNLQDSGAHNLNLVTPTHYALQLAEVLQLAKKRGLKIPVVWNTNSYERIEMLQALEGLIDIYLPDFRYYDSEASGKFSDAEDYPGVAQAALKEMLRQVGHLKEENGIAQRGLMVRLLVMPGNVNRIDKVMKWIYDNLGPETYISLMGQYYPTYRSVAFPEINRSITEEEYEAIVKVLTDLGFKNGFIQKVGSNEDWTPKFVKSQ